MKTCQSNEQQTLSTKNEQEDSQNNQTTPLNESEKIFQDLINNFFRLSKNDKEESLRDFRNKKEIELSKHYNELLKCPQILKKIKVEQHYSILKHAIAFYGKDKFDYYGFLLFYIDLFENKCDRRYSSLFSLFDPSDFDIDGYSKLLNCPNFDPNFSNFKNQNIINIIQELKNNQEQYSNQINELTNSIKELKQQNEKIIIQQESKFNDLKNDITNQIKISLTEVNNTLNSHLKTNDEIKLNVKQIIDDQKSNHKNLISFNSELQKQIQTLNDSFSSQIILYNEIKQQNSEILNQQKSNSAKIIESNNQNFTSIKSEYQKQLQLLNDSFNSQKNLYSEIKKDTKQLIEDQIVNNKNAKNINSELKNEIQLLKTEIQNQSKNNITQLKDQISNLHKMIQEEQNKQTNRNISKEEFIEIQGNLKIIKDKINDSIFYNKIKIRKAFNNDAFSGIFSELTKKNGGNINDKGIIKITGNIKGNPSYGNFSSLVNFSYSDYAYFSSEDPNSYLCFDFIDYSISVSAYSLKSANHSEPDFIQSWVVECSNDQKNWTIIDSHLNDHVLCSPSKVHTFIIDEKYNVNDPYQFVRIRITGPSSRGKNHLEITNVEFFGKLFKL